MEDNIISELAKYTYDNTSEYSLNGLTTICRVVDIYDGDTCSCIIGHNNVFHKYKVRLAEIDTCEIKSKIDDNHQLALQARKKLCSLISNKLDDIDINITRKNLRTILNNEIFLLQIKCGEFDKYGRLLGWLYSNDNISLNQLLINAHLAYSYNGGTKLSETSQINTLNT